MKAKEKKQEELRLAIMEAFKETECMDLYNGNLVQYVQVTGQVLRETKAKLRRLERASRFVARVLESQ